MTVLLASEPSALTFPELSENTPLATLITPFAVLFALGVKTAVYVAPLPVKFERTPPVTTTSPIANEVDDSLKLNVIVAVLPADKLVKLELKLIVGGVVSTSLAVSEYEPTDTYESEEMANSYEPL